jgi:hypothetical protein
MAGESLRDRVAALEVKVGSKTLEEQFREQAELIDRLFDYRFDQLGKQLNPRFVGMERTLGVVQGDVSTLKSDVSTLKSDVNTLKSDVKVLQKDVVIVREGISILLKRRPR